MKKSIITMLSIAVGVVLLTIFRSYSMEEKSADPSETQTPKETAVEQVATEQQVVELLQNLIKQNADFSVQISRPELPIQGAIWQRKGQVQLPQGVTWELFKKAVHQFGVDLHTLLEQDENGVYYHIKDVQHNPPLYAALSALSTQITKRSQKESGLVSITKGFGKRLIPLINSYIHAFYTQKLIEQIKGFLAKFEERAKKMRLAQEEAQKRAEQGVKSPSDFDFDYTLPETSYDESLYETPEYELPSELEALESREEAGMQELPGLEMPKIKFEDIDWGF